MKTVHALASLVLAAAAALPAHAAVDGFGSVRCADSFTVFAGGYVACIGPVAGALDASVAFAGHGTFAFASALNGGSADYGTLAFGPALGGSFVIGLEGGGTHSYYLFDGGSAGIAAIDFDTYGVADTTAGGAGPNLAHAALYTVSAVPEPGTPALWLAGVAAAGLVARRRSGRR